MKTTDPHQQGAKQADPQQDRHQRTKALMALASSLAAKLDAQRDRSVWDTLMPHHDTPITAIIQAHSECLHQSIGKLEETSIRVTEEKDDDLTLRGQIGEAIIELRDTIRRTRERIIEVDGPDTLQIYQLTHAPPRARQALIDYTHQVIDLLRTHPYTFQDSLGEPIATKRVARALEQNLAPLETLVHQMDDEMEELQHALKQRNDALEQWSDCYQGIAKLLEGLLTLAHMDDDIAKLRTLM